MAAAELMVMKREVRLLRLQLIEARNHGGGGTSGDHVTLGKLQKERDEYEKKWRATEEKLRVNF